MPQIPEILAAVFEPTLQMITGNLQDYPNVRVAFFKLLESINNNCFEGVFFWLVLLSWFEVFTHGNLLWLCFIVI